MREIKEVYFVFLKYFNSTVVVRANSRLKKGRDSCMVIDLIEKNLV
jgi:hypothetical protein